MLNLSICSIKTSSLLYFDSRFQLKIIEKCEDEQNEIIGVQNVDIDRNNSLF